MQATYHRRKLYVPDEVVREVGLKDGDKVEYVVRGEDMLELKINRRSSSKDLLLDALNNPRPLGVKSTIRRRELYEDID